MNYKASLKFYTNKRLHRRRHWYSYQVTIYGPLGAYPKGTHHVDGGFFYADEDIVFSVVRGGSWAKLDAELPYQEIRGLSPDQLRLVTALMLCERRGDAHVILYPELDLDLRIDARNLRLDREDVVEKIKGLVTSDPRVIGLRSNYDTSGGYSKALVDPCRYMLDRLGEFWSKLDPIDYVLFRGVHALMKSDMLSRHREFWEEATISCYIALDASFSLIKERVETGIRQASAHDAAVWLHDNFDASFDLPPPNQGEKYFEQYYEERVMTLHPLSKFGESPFAPMIYDDLFCLRRNLREIFAYLVSGRHGQDYHDDVAVHRGARRPSG